MTAEKVDLGRRLFYDPRLSGKGKQACASCHQQKYAFTDARPRALGSTGELHPRGAMSLANAAYTSSLTWMDAGALTLEGQMLVPLLADHPVEMGLKGKEDEVLLLLRLDPLYSKLFSEAFPVEPVPVKLRNVQKAIACFERTLLSGNSPYDRLVWKDERDALSPSARRGMALFHSARLACASCHAGFTFSGAVAWEGRTPEPATYEDNGLGGRFRTPTLRNIAVTAPYMHDGRFATLGDVIAHYASGGAPSPTRSTLVRGFRISPGETADLVAFLESLTDEAFLVNPALSDPWKESSAAQRASARTNPAPLKHIEAPAPRPESGSDSSRISGTTSPP